jgi:hypothetical protein
LRTFDAGGKEHFVTGDMAVTWRNPHFRPPFGAGLGMKSTELSFPISPQLCLIEVRQPSPAVTDLDDGRVLDLNSERARHAQRFVFSDNESADQWVLARYKEFEARGEAHATPIRFMVFTDDGPETIRS